MWATGMNNVKTPLLLHQQDLEGIVLDHFAIAVVEINQLFESEKPHLGLGLAQRDNLLCPRQRCQRRRLHVTLNLR